MKLFKLIKLYGGFKDVRKVVTEESGKKAPVWMSRKAIGSVLVFVAAVVLYFTGVQIDADIVTNLADNVEKLVSAVVALYGIIMVLVSLFKKKAKEA